MRTVKWNPFLSGGCMLLGSMLLWVGAARADVSSSNPAALVVFPKLVVAPGVDTEIQLTNASSTAVNVRCFYIDANGHCAGAPSTICDPNEDPATSSCPNACIPSWQETDFSFRLTPKQPIVWSVSEGLLEFPLANRPGPTTQTCKQGSTPGKPCATSADCSGGTCSATSQFNSDSSIPPAPEAPFFGELKCVEVDDSELPVAQNDLFGEATITTSGIDGATLNTSSAGSIDIRGYNGIGVQAKSVAHPADNTLVLDGQQYNSCPAVLMLDHFFDGAPEPALGETVHTDLTLAPCSEDFNLQVPTGMPVQFLVFNEFEQRFSTSRHISCLTELTLSDIDTRPGPDDNPWSIFNFNVEGTLTGQTNIRGVGPGHGLLAVAEEFHSGTDGTHSAAFAVHQRGTRTAPDTIVMPPPQLQ